LLPAAAELVVRLRAAMAIVRLLSGEAKLVVRAATARIPDHSIAVPR
jgi:hypothetical protein